MFRKKRKKEGLLEKFINLFRRKKKQSFLEKIGVGRGNKKRKKNGALGFVVLRKFYETSVGSEAVKRAGHNPQLKGIIHEILYRDSQNFNIYNVISGVKSTLSKSKIAIRDDVLLIKNGNVVGRSQLKDTVNSISYTVKQVLEGKYLRTNLMGTKETVKAYEEYVGILKNKGVIVSQKMKSTGISSSDTQRIATEMLGGKISAQIVADFAKNSAIIGGGISAGISLVTNGRKLAKGEITRKKFTIVVVRDTVGGGLLAGVGSATSTVVSVGLASALATTSAPVWFPAMVGIAAAISVGAIVKKGYDVVTNNIVEVAI